MNILQQPLNGKENITVHIHSIKDVFGQGVPDEVWIPIVGAKRGIVITQDYRIQTLKHQRELYKKYGVGIFFFKPPSKGGFLYWEMVRQILDKWDRMKAIIKKEKLPFAYKTSARSEFDKLDD